ncbi:hypothetical protein L6164_001706 [Bauhinia variegata]|uniref:Uncharacterized protein n=1 Tax=Bauhinia variegata TaxID=167791 RepID=A0ACB9QAX4_BAUVA|nr:hypothetical protein L6164_001706 [Bauhinia variegata]
MVRVHLFHILSFCHLLSLLSTGEGHGKCPSSFNCGYLETIQFPFTTIERPDCGILALHGCGDDSVFSKGIQLEKGELHTVRYIDHSTIFVKDESLRKHLQSRSCKIFNSNYTSNLPLASPLASFDMKYNVTMFRCDKSLHIPLPTTPLFSYTNYSGYNIYYLPRKFELSMKCKPLSSFTECSKIQLPIKDEEDNNDPFTFLSAEVPIEVRLSEECASVTIMREACVKLTAKERFIVPKQQKDGDDHSSNR